MDSKKKSKTDKKYHCKSCENLEKYSKNLNTSKKGKSFKNHNENEAHHNENEHDHSIDKIWKLIIGWILLFPLLWTLFNVFGLESIVPDLFENGWFQFSINTILMIIIGSSFWRETWNDAKRKKLSVEILVSISSTFAYVFSTILLIIATINPDLNPVLFFEASSEILVIIFTGRYVEYAVKRKALNEIELFKELIPNTAILIKDGRQIEVLASELIIDDIVIVKKGEKIPADGIIIEGFSIVLEASFTGEMANFEKTIGDKVLGGAISSTGTIQIKVLKPLSESVVSQILEGIQTTQKYQAKTQNVADKIASYLIPTVFILSILSLILWGTINGNWYNATQIMISVMVIACPCSLGLTTPTSILVGSSVSSNLGIFFNSKNVFENFKSADAIVLDKTGTLTTGEITLIENNIPTEYRELIYKVESNFTHPIAKAITKNNTFDNVIKNELDFNFEELDSLGVKIIYKEKTFYLGSEKLLNLKIENVSINEDLLSSQKQGKIVIFFFDESKIIGNLVLGDQIKKTSEKAIREFEKKGIQVYMVTGDNINTALYVASQLGIPSDNVYGDTLPIEKKTIVQNLQAQGKSVIFVGDGNNDAVAMKQANLSISMNSGTEIAIKSSDVTIVQNDLMKINDVIYLSEKTLFNIYRGFGISILYNIIAIPLAMSGLIPPIAAATLMMISDIIAVLNSLTLRLILYKKEYRKINSDQKNIKHQIKKESRQTK